MSETPETPPDAAAGAARPPGAPPEPPEPPPLGTPWRVLSLRRRVLRVLAAAFVVVHMGSAMYTMAPPGKWRAPVDEGVGIYTSRLRMATRWDMFGAPPDTAMVIVEGRERGGPRFRIADPFERGWDMLRRIVDARLRKFHQKLKKKSHRRRWGEHYLAYVCRAGRRDYPGLRDVRLIRLDPETRRDDGKVAHKAKSQTLLRYNCDGTPVKARPPRPTPSKKPPRHPKGAAT